jgi:hypothetical protein
MDITETQTAPDPTTPEPPLTPASARPNERCQHERCLTLAVTKYEDQFLCIRHLREKREESETSDDEQS